MMCASCIFHRSRASAQVFCIGVGLFKSVEASSMPLSEQTNRD